MWDKKHKRTVLFLLIFGSLLISSTALAFLADWPTSPLGTAIDPNSELHDLISYIYEWGVGLGGLAVFIVLIIAGVQYLTSAGRPETMRAARDRIRSAIIGLILLLSIWIILNTISPELVTMEPLDLSLEDLVLCDTDDECQDRFGEYFECKEGTCVLNTEEFQKSFTPKPCKFLYVSSTWNSGTSIDDEALAPGEQVARWITWPTNADFIDKDTMIYVRPEPEEGDEFCTSVLTMYEGRWDKRCAGTDWTQTIVVTREEIESGDIREREIPSPSIIKCVEHTEITTPW